MPDRNNEQIVKPGLEAGPAVPTVEHAPSETEGSEPTSSENQVESKETTENKPPTPAKAAARKSVVIPPRDELAAQVEKILEADLGDAYSRLSPIAQQEFKLKGEKTARTIRELMKSTHLKVKKIFRLVLEWLKLLPGINRFFLEQEAKIKTDRIIELHKDQR